MLFYFPHFRKKPIIQCVGCQQLPRTLIFCCSTARWGLLAIHDVSVPRLLCPQLSSLLCPQCMAINPPCRHGTARRVIARAAAAVIWRDVCFLQGQILPYWIGSHNHDIQHLALSNDQYLMFQMKLKAPNSVTGELCVAEGKPLFYWLWVPMKLKTQLLP